MSVTPVEAGALGEPEQPPQPRTSNVPAAVFWMVGTLLSFSLMAISVRQLGGMLNLFELLMVRAVGGLAHPAGRDGGAAFAVRLSRAAQAGHASVRNGTHFIANLCWTNAVIVLPLATVFAIEFMMPVWAGLLAVLFLGERFTASRAGTIVLGFLGVLIILRPGIEAFQPAAIGVLVASFGYAVSNIGTKKLIPVQSTIAILFWMNVMQIGHGADRQRSAVSAAARIGTSGSGRSASRSAAPSAHYCLTNALRVADAIVVIPLDFLRIPLIAFVGWMFYGERLDVLVFAGAGIIVSGIIWNLRAEMR